MRLTIRDGLATLLVAAAWVVYLLWVTGAAMTGWSVRVGRRSCSVWGGPPALLIRSRWRWFTGPPRGRRPAPAYVVLRVGHRCAGAGEPGSSPW